MKIELPYPSDFGQYSTNRYYSGKPFPVRNRDKDVWKWIVYSALLKAKIPKRPLDYPVEIIFSFDDRLDCSNHSIVEKMIEDALKGWVLKDDTRKWVKRITTEFNDEKRLTVEVVPFGMSYWRDDNG